MAFTQELLDIDFATSTRDGLLAWANYNNSPNTLTGLPASLSTKVLCLSLTTGPSPVPTAKAWNLLATTRTTWRVSGLVVSVNPTWIQVLSGRLDIGRSTDGDLRRVGPAHRDDAWSPIGR